MTKHLGLPYNAYSQSYFKNENNKQNFFINFQQQGSQRDLQITKIFSCNGLLHSSYFL